MPRYFFNVGDRTDHEGVELPDVARAKCEAVRHAGRLICDSADGFWDAADFNMSVTDDRGLVLFTLHMVGVEAPALRGAG